MAVKICSHCRSKTRLDVERCPSCGGSEFWYKCANCGKIFNTPFCPSCGLKAGEQPKKCPKCRKQYFTASCPDCGWNPAHDDIERVLTQQTQHSVQIIQATPVGQTSKKKVSFWTILLWIFFLPIMGCIAIWKSKKLSKKWKLGLIGGIAVITIIVGVTGQSGDNEVKEASQPLPTTSPIAEKLQNKEQPTTIPSIAITETPSQEVYSQPTTEPTIVPKAEPTEDIIPESINGYINARSLNMRAEPSKESDIVQECDGKQTVEIIGEDGDWYRVNVAGATGYMLKEYIIIGDIPEPTEKPITRSTQEEPKQSEAPIDTTEPPTSTPREIPYSQNYHGHVYTGGEQSVNYHYEAECAGKYSHEITWADVDKLHLNPCDTCVAK